MDLTVLLETMDLMESDGNNWFIETDGTNGTNKAERIDGADRSYRTLVFGMEDMIELKELMEPLE